MAIGSVGLIPEAMREVIRHAFEECGIQSLWCGDFDGNEKLKRVSEKLGLSCARTEQKHRPPIGQTKIQDTTHLTKREWEERD